VYTEALSFSVFDAEGDGKRILDSGIRIKNLKGFSLKKNNIYFFIR
jgi:hypothetical protein